MNKKVLKTKANGLMFIKKTLAIMPPQPHSPTQSTSAPQVNIFPKVSNLKFLLKVSNFKSL